jgi:hypothetical protein
VTVQNLAERVAGAFAEGADHHFGDAYLTGLLERWSQAQTTIRRDANSLVILAAAFVLLKGAKTGEVSLGPVRITDVVQVLPLLLGVIAYLYWRMVHHALALRSYAVLVAHVIETLHPAVSQAHLGEALEPLTSHSWSGGVVQSVRHGSESRKRSAALRFVGRVQDLLLLGGAPAFLVFAFIYLLGTPHLNWPTYVLSLGFTMFNVTRAQLVWSRNVEGDRIAPPDQP